MKPLGPGRRSLAGRGVTGRPRRNPSKLTHYPSVLYLPCDAIQTEPSLADPRPGVRLRLHQTLAGSELVRESSSPALFLPSEFDLTQPFELELELSPGRYVFYGPALIGAAARE